jgi:mandelate racemase
MTVPRPTFRGVELRSVVLPLKRPIVSKIGLFDRWPLILIDLHTDEGIGGRSYLEPYLERSVLYVPLGPKPTSPRRAGSQRPDSSTESPSWSTENHLHP